MSRKNILLLSPWYFPDSAGGTEIYVHALGKELKKQDFNIRVAAPSNREEENSYVYDGLEVYRYPVSLKPTEYELRNKTKPRHFGVFADWVEKNRPDIVHMHSVTRGCGLFHARFIKGLGIPLILTVHLPDIICARGTMMRWGKIPCSGGMKPSRCASCYMEKQGLPRFIALAVAGLSSGGFSGFLGGINKRLRTALEMKDIIASRNSDIQNLCGLSDKIVVLSKWLYNTLGMDKKILNKLCLSRHGLTLEKFIKPAIRPWKGISEGIKIGYIGRFNPVKGVHILIKAVRALSPSFPVKLVLYGRVNGREDEIYLKKLREISRKDSRIFFGGEITDENRVETFNNLDVIAVPSVWFETGPFVVLEAHAAGIPVIGTNIGGIAELVRDGVNGILVRAGDIKGWRDAIKKISLQPALLENLARKIPPVRTNIDVTFEMAELYKQIAG